MAIVKMRKFTLLAFDAYKDALLQGLQRFEEVHFRNMQKEDADIPAFLAPDRSGEHIAAIEDELYKIRYSISKLAPYYTKPKGLKAYTTPPPSLPFNEFEAYAETYDYRHVFAAIQAADERIQNAKTELSRLRSENENLKLWREFDIAPADLTSLRLSASVVGQIPKLSADEFRASLEREFPALYAEHVGTMKDELIFLFILPADEFDAAFSRMKELGFTRITPNFSGVPVEIMSENLAREDELKQQLKEAEEQIRAQNTEYENLQIARDFFETRLMRARVAENFLKTETVLYIEGWVPEEEAPEFRSIVRNTCHDGYALEEEEVERDSLIVPIKLKNNKFVKAFESITAMYSMPRYNEIDPTPVLAPFYWLFFGLMAGDIGYGLVLMLGTALALRFFHLKESMRSFMQFFFYLSIAMTLAGFLYGSAFSVTVFTPLPMEGGGYKAILDSNTDIITMLILSIALGVIQIIVGLCVKAYMLLRDGRPFSAIFDSLFFILVLLSGIGLILGMTGMLPETVKTISWWTFWAMLAGLALTQGRESPSIGGKIGNGLYAVYGLTSYVGDIVSYTRIVALALSGAYIGFSFNQLIVQVLPDNLFIKIVFGAAIALIGHLLNFGLSLLSAYVHTCRLQYVEYFGKFYEGGGVPFAPFKLQNTYVQIKK